MKNIHKIIESPTEIMDKCAWWYNTITGETLRWNGTIWEVISSQGGSSEQLEAGAGITIENNTISTNVGGDIVVSSNNNLSIWQIPGVKRVRFLNKGKVDLNRKYEVGLVPPSTKSRFIRFIHTDIASQYTETVKIPGNPEERPIHYDASSQLLKRQDLVNKTQVFLNDTLVQFDIQYKLKTISNTNGESSQCTPHRVNPVNSLWDDSGLKVHNHGAAEAQFKAIPYIVILNPFIEYGGKVIYQYKVENGNYIIKVKTEDIKHKEVLFDTKGQQYLEFQEAQQGKLTCTKGSFTSTKYLYFHHNKISNNPNFWKLFTPRKAKVRKYSNRDGQSSYEKVSDYVAVFSAFARNKWDKYNSRQIIVMCIDKLAKHKFSGLEEREVWKVKNLAKHSGNPGKVGNKIFRIQ